MLYICSMKIFILHQERLQEPIKFGGTSYAVN
jgi:hypothetical protein